MQVVYTVEVETPEQEKQAREFKQSLYDTYEEVNSHWNGRQEMHIVATKPKVMIFTPYGRCGAPEVENMPHGFMYDINHGE